MDGFNDELYLEITDDYKTVDFFNVEQDYKQHYSSKRYNNVQVSVMHDRESVAYLECYLFFDERINETGVSLVTVADEELTDDAYEAMRILEKQGCFERDDSSNLFYVLATKPISTLYIRRIAVRENYRGRGIGGWLLRNLRDIIEINYSVKPAVAIVKLFPERIIWDGSVPRFTPDLLEGADFNQMIHIMGKLFEANNFLRHGDSSFFIRDYAKEWLG